MIQLRDSRELAHQNIYTTGEEASEASQSQGQGPAPVPVPSGSGSARPPRDEMKWSGPDVHLDAEKNSDGLA